MAGWNGLAERAVRGKNGMVTERDVEYRLVLSRIFTVRNSIARGLMNLPRHAQLYPRSCTLIPRPFSVGAVLMGMNLPASCAVLP